MAENNRIFYACQAVSIAPCFTHGATGPIVHGVQSVGITTNFNLEQAFELGQIQIYENIEGTPDVEVTLEKVLDGYPLMYHLASSDATAGSLVNRAARRSCVALGIYPEDKDSVTGNAPVEVYMSGMYISSLSYSFPTDGNCTESLTLVGNSKEWNSGAPKLIDSASAAGIPTDGNGAGTDEPQAYTDQLGGIQRREDVMVATSILPQSIYGVDQNDGAGNGWDASVGDEGAPKVHIQNLTISTDLGRDDINELGRKTPYYRSPNFPTEVSSEFEVIAISGDFVSAYESGDPDLEGTPDEGNNTKEETIKIILRDGSIFDLGTKNRLSSVTYGGGDAGGGNATITYSYSTFNDLIVTHPQDPAGL
jgi:hypothetical protein